VTDRLYTELVAVPFMVTELWLQGPVYGSQFVMCMQHW